MSTQIPRFDFDPASPLSAGMRARWAADGLLVVRDFLAPEACARLRAQAAAWRARLAPDSPRVAFETDAQSHAQSDHFATSGGAVRLFVEDDDPSQPNKLGHAMHDLDPVFSAAARDPRLEALCAGLGMADPRLVQSMYIFKPPGAGGAVGVHQDAAFLRTSPPTVVGFWMALHDADRDNGCLWALPGQHTEAGPRARFGYDGGSLALDTLDARPWDMAGAVPLEVSAGTLVVLSGLLPHFSHPNRSARPREAMTVHVVDGAAAWLPANWLRRAAPFEGFQYSPVPTRGTT